MDNGSQELILSEHCNTVVIRWVLRERAKILYGPYPQTFMTPTNPETLRKDILRKIIDWGKKIREQPTFFYNKFCQTFIVLNYCRMYHDLTTAMINSKRVGSEWAKSILDPEWTDLIDRAWFGRPVPERSVREKADSVDFAKTIELIKIITFINNKERITMQILDIIHRQSVPSPWAEGEKIPWNDPDFSRRMLNEHLSQAHDAASRRFGIIDKHVNWIHTQVLKETPTRVLDLGSRKYTS